MRAARLVLAVSSLSALFFVTRPLAGQSVYGQVSGRLTTGAGKPVSGASVSLTSVQTAANARTKSDTDGYFIINNLTPDLYQVDVQAGGFKRIKEIIAVNADSTTSVNAPLQVGDPNVVAGPTTAGVSVLKLDRTDVSTLFNSRSVDELPLRDLNLTQLELLVPGAARGQLFIPPNQNPQGGQPVNINGQHFSGSAFQLDGTENRDPVEGIIVINPTLDSVREMKVTTQGYNAEFGQATAGVITVQTRSGSNSWHGDAFGFRRTGWGQSVDPFAPAGVPPSKYDIFGGSFGGPIAKNKLFVFGDYQGTRSSQGADLLLSVPSLRVRQTCLGSAGPPGSLCDLSQYSKFISGTLLDPFNNKAPFLCPPQGGTPCNEIPNTRVTDQAVALLALLPPPNQKPTDQTCAADKAADAVCNNYLASGREIFSGDQFDLRTDYNVSSRLRFFGRYNFGDFFDNGSPAFGTGVGGLGADPSGFAGVARTRNQGISSGFTYSLNQKILTDFRFGYFRYRLNINAQDYGQTPAIDMPQLFAPTALDPFATGMPDFEIPGQQIGNAQGLFPGTDYLRLGYSLATNFCNCPLREREQQFQFVNNWTHSAGQHIIKWGADFRFLQNYRLESTRPRTGFYSFAPPATGLGLATFLLGDVTSFERYISGPSVTDAGEHQKRIGFYGQDTWRINTRLTLNYGLRWEIYYPQTVTVAGGFLIPNLSVHDPRRTFFSVPPATNTAGGVTGNLTNFAPRLGIGYLINSTTVVRAGYGRSFDAGYAGDLFGVAATQNPPVTADQNIQGGFNLANQNAPPKFAIPSNSPFSLADLATTNKAQNGSPASGALLYALPPGIRIPTVDSWNLTFQHELTPHMYFELGYVGNKGTHVFPDNASGTFYLLSQPSLQNLIVETIRNGAPVQGVDTNNCQKAAFFDYGIVNGKPQEEYCLTLPQVRSFYEQVAGFNPNLFKVRYFGNNANDDYNSLQVKAHKDFSRGYSFMAHYTWSKGLDYDSNYFAVNPQIGYGPTSFDIRHRFVMTNIWDLPMGRGRAWLGGIGTAADRFLGRWTISAITIWQSGLPFTPSYIATACLDDTDSGDPCRPNRVAPVHVSGSRKQYFSTTGTPLQGSDCVDDNKFCGVDANGKPVPGPAIGPWQRPGAGQIGNVGRDSFTGPGFFQSDIGLAKVIPISERTTLRFRGDAFNVFNKVNLGSPNACVDCTGGGAITSLTPGAIQRVLQFSLRIEF